MERHNSTPAQGGFLGGLSPLTKTVLSVGIIVLLALLIQLGAWLVGTDFDVFSDSGGGRAVLLVLAVGVLLVLMGADRRPASAYGLAVGPRWQWKLLGGFAAGLVLYAGYCLLAVMAGVFRFNFSEITPYRCTSASISALAAFPVALVQQIIFSGYILSMYRDRYSRVTAVLCSAFVFAALCRINDPGSLVSGEPQWFVIGMFLIATLLGILRVSTGSIVVPTGFLAGSIFARRIFRRTSTLIFTGNSEVSPWLAPYADPRQAPLMWAFLAVGIVVCGAIMLRKKPSEQAAAKKASSLSFKRFYPFSHVSILAPMDVWLGRLVAARFRVPLLYIPRLLAVLTFSAVNTLISLPERLLLPLVLRKRRVPDPVFILGVHRSGTTHLHNLLSLDDRYCAPLAYQTINPVGFLFSGWLITPILGAFMPWKRPMDAVRFHLFAPQEEEFAISAVSRLSPYWLMSFPRQTDHYERYAYPEGFTAAQSASWKRHYMLFLRKLTFWHRKHPLLKNPYNTGRPEMLREMFPEAKFIHISRHPHDVYRSNMHLAREGHVVHQLQDPDPNDSYRTRFLDNYYKMEQSFYQQTAELPSDQVAEVRFEDIERDPIGEVRRIYAQLGIEMTPRFEQRLRNYLDSIAGYRKNSFRQLPEDEREKIDSKMGPFMARWGYSSDRQAPEARANKAA